jgi:hypothetical protein
MGVAPLGQEPTTDKAAQSSTNGAKSIELTDDWLADWLDDRGRGGRRRRQVVGGLAAVAVVAFGSRLARIGGGAFVERAHHAARVGHVLA